MNDKLKHVAHLAMAWTASISVIWLMFKAWKFLFPLIAM
jgi:hypothetical protein